MKLSFRRMVMGWLLPVLLVAVSFVMSSYVQTALADDFTKATLPISSDFSNKDLTTFEFTQASVRMGKFVNANMSGVSFIGGDFDSADMTGANLTNALLDTARFTRVNLALCQGVMGAKRECHTLTTPPATSRPRAHRSGSGARRSLARTRGGRSRWGGSRRCRSDPSPS